MAIEWKNGARCAVMLSFDLDGETLWIARDPVAFARYVTSLYDSGSASFGTTVVSPGRDLRNQDYDGRAVPAFMSQALTGNDVTIFGDGTQTRSFTYVSDLVDGILRLMESDTNEPVNIGNPHEVTIEEIARMIIKLVGSSSRLVHRPLPIDDPKQRRPDITRARSVLKWEPKVGLEEGLLNTVGYFKAKLADR